MVSRKERPNVRERFLAVGTANASDALDELGFLYQGIAPEVQAVSGSRLAGWCYTITGRMGPYEETGDERKMAACDGIGPEEVSVWSGDGKGVCYFGELLALGMIQRGSVGAMVDGGLRDVRWLDQLGFPAFARFRSAVQSIGRWRVTDWQIPVYLRGATSRWVTARPGDFVLGDEDGAIIIPQDVVREVLERAERVTKKEDQVRAALERGMSLTDALARFGHL